MLSSSTRLGTPCAYHNLVSEVSFEDPAFQDGCSISNTATADLPPNGLTGRVSLEPAFCNFCHGCSIHNFGPCPSMRCLAQLYLHSADNRETGSGKPWRRAPPNSAPPAIKVRRHGEAENPGPTLTIGTTNPTGLNGKALYISTLAPGIWNVSETHLAVGAIRPFDRQLKFHAQNDNRRLRTTYGAPAPLRTGSHTTGTWTGVMQLADAPLQPIRTPNLDSYYQLGRLQHTRFWIDNIQISSINLYAWPTSPSWPNARTLTEGMLQAITEEFILGSHGLRYVAGDFNHPESLPSLRAWRQAGWEEIQVLHARLSGHAPQNTYRGISSPDRIYISPELAAYFTRATFTKWFSDHGALSATFKLPDRDVFYWAWPQPSRIPWDRCLALSLCSWPHSPSTND